MSCVPIVLASRSPRRSQLLGQIGVAHEVLAVDLDETRQPGEPPRAYAERLAREKALLARQSHPSAASRTLLAADTVVALGEEVYAKPADEEDCVRMLGALSGRTHEVITAIAVHDGRGLTSDLSVSRVTFRVIGEDESRRYWKSGEPADKAGGYAIQGFGAVFVERLEGSCSCVMGLPLFETARLLAAAGAQAWQEGATR